MVGGAQRIFRVVELFRMILSGWIRVTIHLSKPTEHTAARVNPNGDYRVELIITCQYWLVAYNKCTTLK